jgi:hypothetical protein
MNEITFLGARPKMCLKAGRLDSREAGRLRIKKKL